jgi:hypothetical protein
MFDVVCWRLCHGLVLVTSVKGVFCCCYHFATTELVTTCPFCLLIRNCLASYPTFPCSICKSNTSLLTVFFFLLSITDHLVGSVCCQLFVYIAHAKISGFKYVHDLHCLLMFPLPDMLGVIWLSSAFCSWCAPTMSKTHVRLWYALSCAILPFRSVRTTVLKFFKGHSRVLLSPLWKIH